MADINPNPAPAPKDGGPANAKRPLIERLWFGFANPLRVIGGVFLFALVLAAGIVAVTLFAATQFQLRVTELTVNGTPLTIWRVDKLKIDFDAHGESLKKIRDELLTRRAALSQAEAERDYSSDEVKTAEQEILGSELINFAAAGRQS